MLKGSAKGAAYWRGQYIIMSDRQVMCEDFAGGEQKCVSRHYLLSSRRGVVHWAS